MAERLLTFTRALRACGRLRSGLALDFEFSNGDESEILPFLSVSTTHVNGYFT